jgi:hypothetical protein
LKSLGKSTEPLHTVLLTGSTVMSAAATSVTARVGAVASTACARVTHAAAAPRPRVAVARKSVSAIAFRRRRGDAHVTRAGKKKPGDAANDVANMDALIDNLIAADEESLVKLVAENVLSFSFRLGAGPTRKRWVHDPGGKVHEAHRGDGGENRKRHPAKQQDS